MFKLPRFVKTGRVLQQGEVRQDLFGRTQHVAPAYDEERVRDIPKWFESFYTIQFANYPAAVAYLAHGATAVECQPRR